MGAEREVRGDGHLLVLRKELELDMFTGTVTALPTPSTL